MYRGLSDNNPTSAHTNQAEVTNAAEFELLALPVRSTTRTNIAPLVSLCTASLSLEEMREDMQTIGWEEFAVQSVVTVETAAPPAMLKSCRFAEKNCRRKEMQNESVSMCSIPSVKMLNDCGFDCMLNLKASGTYCSPLQELWERTSRAIVGRERGESRLISGFSL